jgi:AcrR family transcriptional regulator
LSGVSYQSADRRAVQIMHAARNIFLSEGWDHFSMERIAEFLECSRPIVYKHFGCKEEILLALAIESKRRRVRFYERAVDFDGRPREKFVGIGECESYLFPRDLPVELFVASTAIRAKTSRARRDELNALDLRAIGLSTNIVREAIDVGDLELAPSIRVEDFFFCSWAIRWGAFNLIRSDTPLEQAGMERPRQIVDHSLARMLDSYGWRPLRTEWDYKATLERLRAEAFPEKVVHQILNS